MARRNDGREPKTRWAVTVTFQGDPTPEEMLCWAEGLTGTEEPWLRYYPAEQDDGWAYGTWTVSMVVEIAPDPVEGFASACGVAIGRMMKASKHQKLGDILGVECVQVWKKYEDELKRRGKPETKFMKEN